MFIYSIVLLNPYTETRNNPVSPVNESVEQILAVVFHVKSSYIPTKLKPINLMKCMYVYVCTLYTHITR